jgi:hypothetical protein
LLGKESFYRLSKQNPQLLKPDVLVLDEAHTMLSNKVNEIYKALSLIQTSRKILLTGMYQAVSKTRFLRFVLFRTLLNFLL